MLCIFIKENLTYFNLPDPNKEYKPKVKQWLYRKIYLDEFKSFEYAEGKRKIGDLRRSIESVLIQKKKKAPKPKPPAPSPQHQVSLPPEHALYLLLSSPLNPLTVLVLVFFLSLSRSLFPIFV